MLNTNDRIGGNNDGYDTNNHSLSSDLNAHQSNPIPGSKEHERTLTERIQNQETKVIRGEKNVNHIIKLTHKDCKTSLDVYCDKNGPCILMNIPLYTSLYTDLKSRGVRIRIITEITAENLECCKKIEELFNAKIMYLEGIKGNFAILDNKLYAVTSILEASKPIPEFIYSNAEGIVDQNKYLFETLWKKALFINQRIKEIETGLSPESTRVIEDSLETKRIFLNLLENAKEEVRIFLPSSSTITRQSQIGIFDFIKKKEFTEYKNQNFSTLKRKIY